MTTNIPAGLSAIQRYVRLEKIAGRNGDWRRAQAIALQVNRACTFYGYSRNPY